MLLSSFQNVTSERAGAVSNCEGRKSAVFKTRSFSELTQIVWKAVFEAPSNKITLLGRFRVDSAKWGFSSRSFCPLLLSLAS